jgi:hypothetical protein
VDFPCEILGFVFKVFLMADRHLGRRTARSEERFLAGFGKSGPMRRSPPARLMDTGNFI